MKRAGKIAIVVIAAFLLYLYTQPSYTHRFRLTIEVETPDGVKTGSSVIETSTWESGNWGPVEARGIRRDFRGRAVFVDLGQNRNLVALLGFGPRGDQDKLFRLVRAALTPGKKIDDWKEEFRLKGRGVLPQENIPTLITFTNLNDPASAVLIDPSNLAKNFGPGYAFRQAVLETTNESVSGNIEKILPWWRSPGRPSAVAYRAWRESSLNDSAVPTEGLFQKE
jgi:hypothetical protein